MGDGMTPEFAQLLAERKLLRITPKRNMILREIEGAEADLKDAEDSLEHKNFKWATIQAYYSMFHSARALLYFRGFREKKSLRLIGRHQRTFRERCGERFDWSI
ncbi:MAG: HEPN domain-containing protein [Nitrososphaerales archaeon]|nr:HEPN domain-containing protein [Nitrososphaerales archaeon]